MNILLSINLKYTLRSLWDNKWEINKIEYKIVKSSATIM